MPSRLVNTDVIGLVELTASGEYALVTRTGTLRNNDTVIRVGVQNGPFIATSIINNGEIISGTGAVMPHLAAITVLKGVADITNNGIIVSTSGYAINVADGARLTNNGSIVGYINFFATNHSSSVVNAGTINGWIAASGNPGLNLTNLGTITGVFDAVTGFSANDRVVNAGRIVGDVALGSGNNFYDGSLGFVVGRVLAYEGNDTLIGGNGADYLYGSEGDDSLVGGWGADTLVSFGGHATLLGGEGDDLFLIDGNAGAVLLDGGPGFDTVDLRWAEAGFLLDLATPTENTGAADVGALLNIEGAIGSLFYADTLLGNAAANALSGGGGDDSLDGRAGADTMIGGTGNDTYRVDQMGDLTIERAGGGFDIVLTTTSYRLAAGWEVEVLSADMEVAAVANANLNLWGSATANAITGTNGVNRLYGRDGHDTLNGLGGNDFLYGENGNDELRGGAGIDRLYGGAGNDALYGGDEADFLYGDAGQDTLFGEAANDQLYGGADADTLAGGDGNDTLFGEAGDDSLSGGDGNDILQGGPGFSLLIGGAGADVFVFDAAGFSRISDFSGPDDTIRLPQALVPVLPTGVLAAAAFSATVGGITAATRIYLGPGYAMAPNERTVNYDPDGSGPLAAIEIGVITNGAIAGITNADFVVIA